MSNNKNIIDIESTLLDNKIVELSTKLNIINQSAIGISQETLIDEAVKFVSTFFSQLSEPIFNPTDATVDGKPDVDIYNKNFADILSDLNIVFLEFENIENIILSHFNFMVSDTNQILTGLKQVYSKLGDYILFSQDPTKDSFFFSDSFNNQSRIDFNSPLLNSTQCDVDQIQGIVTLPIANKTIISVTDQPVINSNSNGTPGNSDDPTGLSADINRINDDNPDTWFEYERVLTADDGIPLTLDITVNLSNPQIINYIRINPNNFGTKNQVVIDSLETSLDGKSYLSIKDDVPINGFITQDENNLFVLAPASSKFAGQGVYSFNPRTVKYVHIILKQFAPYALDESRIRYAIGIRDVEIASISYVNNGEIISANYSSDLVIKKIALITNQNPVIASDLASINHFISADNGSTWNVIEPEKFISDNTVPKIINFNTLDNNSINTQTPVKSLRYKAVLKRNANAFTQGTVQNKNETTAIMELHRIPTQTPFDIILNNKPIENTIKVLDPSFGSRGIDHNKYTIGIGNGSKIEFNIPFTNIRNNLSKVLSGNEYILTETFPEEVRINGQLWTRSYLFNAISTALIYELDNITGKIKFGDNASGKAVPTGATIDIKFTPERLFITSQQLHSGKLQFSTSKDKNSFIIKRYLAPTSFSELVNKNSQTFKLNNTNIISITNFSDKVTFSIQKSFIDGVSELTNDGDWSLDSLNGILHSKNKSSSTDDTTIIYQYIPEFILNNETDWNFDSGDNIIIDNNIFASITATDNIPVNRRYFSLSNLSILQGTVSFTDKLIFKKEVPFINGHIELSNNIKTSEAISSTLLSLNVTTFKLRLPVVNDSTYDVVFSNKSIFATRVNSLLDVNSANKYYINLSTSTVSVYTSETNLGSVIYYYHNQARKVEGLYSINYETGEVYTAVATNANSTVTYQYTNFVVNYPIARKINDNDFTFNNGIVTISEREILLRNNLNSVSGSTQSNFYQIVFDSFVDTKTDIIDMEPFFTPVLKDYAIKIIPEGALLF